jgi:hypothetical protein
MSENDVNVRVNIDEGAQNDQTTSKIKAGLNSISDAASKIAIGAAVVAGIKMLGDKIREYAQEAAAAEAVSDKLGFVLAKNSDGTQEHTDALIEQANALQRVTGFGGDEIINAQTRLALNKLNANEISKLTPLLLDTVEARRSLGETDVDLNATTDLFNKALMGNSKSLQKLNIDLTDAEKKIFAVGTQEERVNLLTTKLSETYGGTAEEMGDKFEKKLAIMDQAAGDLNETIGGTITQNDSAKDAVDAMAAAYDDMSDTIVENADVIGASISATIAVIVSLGNIGKAVFNGLEISAKTAALAVTESLSFIFSGLEKLSIGETSNKFEQSAADFEAISSGLKQSIREDMSDVDSAFSAIVDPLGSLKSAGDASAAGIAKMADEKTKSAIKARQQSREISEDEVKEKEKAVNAMIALEKKHRDEATKIADEIKKLHQQEAKDMQDVLNIGLSAEDKALNTRIEQGRVESAFKQQIAAGDYAAAEESGRRLIELAKTQATEAANAAKTSGDTRDLSVAQYDYAKAVQMTDQALQGKLRTEQTAAEQARTDQTTPQAAADITNSDKPIEKTVVIKKVDEKGNPIAAQETTPEQIPVVAAKVEIVGEPKLIQIDVNSLVNLVPLIQQQAIIAVDERIKLQLRTAQ